ncbi:MAG: hypothetical protein KC983_10170 [Phycisphaerales bacterium]|nr:hypothetical protein [Phycisphaerales bacterium]
MLQPRMIGVALVAMWFAAGAATGIAAPADTAPSLVDPAYHTQDELASALRTLGRRSNVELVTIGRSLGGRDIFGLILSSAPRTHEKRPALLITAGLDGRHLVGTETALRVATALATEHADWLKDVTVYVIPRANPDGAAMSMAKNAGTLHIGTVRSVDDDRDGFLNEDPPQDVNGDGVITMMRRLHPPVDEAPTHLADPADPRLNRTTAGDDDLRATFTLYVEGLDVDGDGRIAEDGPGEVDLDQNFMHNWPEYASEAGVIPLSEPESLALAKFVVDHPNIMAAMTYGRHDNLVNAPDSKGKGPLGRAPKNIDAEDASLYAAMAEAFKSSTSLRTSPRRSIDGSFHAWLYAQRGIPSFATVVWDRPAPPKDDSDDAKPSGDGDTADTPAASSPEPAADRAAGIWSGNVDVPEMGSMAVTLTIEREDGDNVSGTLATSFFTIAMNGTADAGGSLSITGAMSADTTITLTGTVADDDMTASVTGPEGEDIPFIAKRISSPDATDDAAENSTVDGDDDAAAGTKKPAKPQDKDEAAWLKYSDEQRDGAGFIPWSAFDHPTLGAVEIGGFVPGFTMNPPADALDTLATEQTAFIKALIDARPTLTTIGPDVTELGPGLYEVKLALVNDGTMPTRTALAARARTTLPTIVRLSTPVEKIITGRRVERTWRIDGHGGRATYRWIVREPAGSEATITILHPQLGDQSLSITFGGAK